jgi:hypothetical protein
MALTSVGAFYASQSLLLQRIYIPDADDSEINLQPLFPGETVLLVPIETYRTGGPAAIQALVGKPHVTGNGLSNASGRCAVVDKASGLVVDNIIADPALYADPSGGLVIPHDQTCVGDAWTGATFTRQFAEISLATSKYVNITTQNIDTAAPQTAGNILQAIVPDEPPVVVGAVAPKFTVTVPTLG